MTERELQVAWAAGFLDGEGYIALTREGKPVIEVSQIKREPLDRLKGLFGGSICTMGRPTKAGNPIFRWRMTDTPALLALVEMQPLLVVKREIADGILQQWGGEGFGYDERGLKARRARRQKDATILLA